ncbi:hypothetical protein [Nocardia sp. NPDC051750]|uniref:hypothetical protein n=1 Tax=Nocardia sp. NPDC051750 TaxID=3364325 RepID=UPI0037BDBE9F
MTTDRRGPVSIAIRPDPAAEVYGIAARHPSAFTVAELLPDRCSPHGRDVAVRLPVEVKFAEPDPESQQLTLTRSIVDMPGRGTVMSAFRDPAADAVVTAEWPCCSSCLRRMQFSRWTGRVLIGVAVLIPALSLLPIAAPTWFRSLAIYDNRMAFFGLAEFLISIFISALIAARGAFSYARPILHARLNEGRSVLIVSATHPEFAAALDELRAHQDRSAGSS